MDNIDISSWAAFKDTFQLSIYMSLIGAVIGHFRKNGVIQMPIVNISYRLGPHFKTEILYLKPLRGLYIIIDFLLYLIGLRFHKNQEEGEILIDLGFLGDMLVGIGTGILAKCALAVVNSPSNYAVASTSLLAGFAGLSYILSKQISEFESDVEDTETKLKEYGVDVFGVENPQVAVALEESPKFDFPEGKNIALRQIRKNHRRSPRNRRLR